MGQCLWKGDRGQGQTELRFARDMHWEIWSLVVSLNHLKSRIEVWRSRIAWRNKTLGLQKNPLLLRYFWVTSRITHISCLRSCDSLQKCERWMLILLIGIKSFGAQICSIMHHISFMKLVRQFYSCEQWKGVVEILNSRLLEKSKCKILYTNIFLLQLNIAIRVTTKLFE